jgi:hypothetical protein
MDIKIYFSIISHDGVDIGVDAEATLSGKRIEATFHHDIEDDRECIVNDISFTDEDGEEMTGSEKLKEIVYEHVDDFVMQIYKDALACDDENDIYISDFKSDLNFSELI